jgi:hypothetical protein
MKPKNGFVMAMLAAFNVSHVDAIPRDALTLDHYRMLDRAMESEAKSFLFEASATADETKQPLVISTPNEALQKSGLLNTSAEERILISRIHGWLGREMTISDDGIIVAPIKKF